MTSERTEYLKSFDGTALFFRCFTPKKRENKESKIEGLILAVHGFGEHSGRYAELAAEVCNKNLAFACFDLRGHGKSGPRRGDAENLHACVLDVLFMVNHARSILGISNKNQTFFGIIGHSFGGLLVTYAASILHDSCPPLFLSSPCYRTLQIIPQWKKTVAAIVPYFAPLTPLPIGIPPENLSENVLNNTAYAADSLNLFSITARFGSIFLYSMNEAQIQNAAVSIKTPVKIVCGSLDKLVDAQKARSVFPLFQSENKSLSFIEGAGHEIFNEKAPARAVALEHLFSWIRENSSPE